MLEELRADIRVDMMRDLKDGGYRRVEVLTGPGRRRVWDEATKARVVAESYAPGAVVSAVARRWQMAPQQLFTWRREAREAGETAVLPFVPIVSDPPAPEMVPAVAGVEVVLAGAVVRVLPGVDPALLTTVLRAVRASGS
ncbi:IS66-like element accessory protein TnpA [Belnapia sp. F-4-1]|uniref:IS66-like element accessory protein TnpA n=1 Tax=Belnapia sp. F-4-1 TaxID=1545443 RepID=UPI000690E2D2|nr:transposase [Belnapia sp. F-4-1]